MTRLKIVSEYFKASALRKKLFYLKALETKYLQITLEYTRIFFTLHRITVTLTRINIEHNSSLIIIFN